jgi:hypothetical protein
MVHALVSSRVTDPSGVEWVVGRQWLRRPPRWVGIAFRNLRRRQGRAPEAPRLDEDDGDNDWWRLLDGFDIGTPDDAGGCAVVLAVVAVVLAVIVLWVFVLPALILVLDLLLLLAIAGLAAVGRIVFRRPWTVYAGNDVDRATWAVLGWRASGRAVRHVAECLERGDALDEIHPRLL